MSKRYLLAQRTLAGLGTTFNEEDWEDRKSNFHETLCDQLPIEKMLSSKVEFEFETHADRLMIVAYLAPCHQRRPTLPGIAGTQSELFLADINLIKQAQSGLRNSYEIALKSDADPKEDLDLANRRRQIFYARKRGMLTIYSTADGENFPLGSIDKWMPHAKMARMTFAVDRIARYECKVSVRSLIPVQREGDKHSPSVHLPSRQVDISRDQLALGWAAGQILSKAMEEKTELQATIRLEFSWIDGTLSRLTLLEIPTEAVLDASNTAQAPSNITGLEEALPVEGSCEEEEQPNSTSASDPLAYFNSFWERIDQATRR
jgi:hypothetical protein